MNSIKHPIVNFGSLGANHIIAAASIIGSVPQEFCESMILDSHSKSYKEVKKSFGLASGQLACESFFKSLCFHFEKTRGITSAREVENIMCKVFRSKGSKSNCTFNDTIVHNQLIYLSLRGCIRIIGTEGVKLINSPLIPTWPVNGRNRSIATAIHCIPDLMHRLQNTLERKRMTWKDGIFNHHTIYKV